MNLFFVGMISIRVTIGFDSSDTDLPLAPPIQFSFECDSFPVFNSVLTL